MSEYIDTFSGESWIIVSKSFFKSSRLWLGIPNIRSMEIFSNPAFLASLNTLTASSPLCSLPKNLSTWSWKLCIPILSLFIPNFLNFMSFSGDISFGLSSNVISPSFLYFIFSIIYESSSIGRRDGVPPPKYTVSYSYSGYILSSFTSAFVYFSYSRLIFINVQKSQYSHFFSQKGICT